jgi:hypothetical protein
LELTACTVDLASASVQRTSGEVLSLTKLEVQLLEYFAARPLEIVSREQLLAEVWNYRPGLRTRAVDACVNRVRVKIEADPSEPEHLIAVYGHGYRLQTGPSAGPWRVTQTLLVGPSASLHRARDDAGRRVALVTGDEALIGSAAEAHRLCRAENVPVVLGDGPGWLAFDCELVCTMDAVWKHLATVDEPGFTYEAGAWLAMRVLDCIESASQVTDRRDGLPLAMGTFSWSTIWLDAAAKPWIVGWGRTLGTALGQVSPHWLTEAPELGWGARANLAADICAGFQLFDATPLLTRRAPPALIRTITGQALPEDEPMASWLISLRAKVTAAPSERTADCDWVRTRYQEIWDALGIDVSEEAWQQSIKPPLSALSGFGVGV